MSKTVRIILIVIGVLLLFPGACFSLLGAVIGDREGMGYIAIGVLILAAAFALIAVAAPRPKQ